MNNLKRVLALALTGTMLAGMMVVGAGAAFTDSEDIKNTDAVNTMVALNIINGKDDGSFDPNGLVDRAQASKMITVALNAGSDPVLGTKAVPTYTDIRGHWAESYIEYCTSLGIIAGRGDGTFDPAATVTGTELAKMLLIAIGYNADNEGYTNNANWENNINIDASSKGLYKGVAVLPQNPLSRDNAAKMIYNALNAVMVEYDYQLNTVNGELVSVAIAKDKQGAPTILSDIYKSEELEGTLATVAYDEDDAEYAYTLKEGMTGATVKTVYSELDFTDFYGKPVTVMFSDDDNGKDYDKGETVYGMYDNSKEVVVATVGDIAAAEAADEVDVDGETYELENGTMAKTPVYYTANGAVNGDLSKFTATPASTIILVDEAGDGIDYAVVIPTKVGKVTFANATSITVDGVGNLKYEENTIADGIAKDDWVTVVEKANSFNGKTTVTEIDTIEGTITAKKAGQIQVNGTWYKETDDQKTDALNLNGEYELVVIGGYVYKAEAITEVTTDLLVLSKVNDDENYDDTLTATALFADGSTATIYIELGDKENASSYTVGKIYTYEVEDGVYTLEEATADNTGYGEMTTATKWEKGKTAFANGDRLADDAVVFVVYKENSTISYANAEVLTGAAVKDWKDDFGTSVTLLNDKVNGFDTAKVALIMDKSAEDLPSSGNEAYGYIVSAPYTTKEGSTNYVNFDLWNGTETVSVKEKGDTIKDDHKKGTFVEYADEGNGIVNGVTKIDAVEAAVMAYDGDNVELLFDGYNGTYEIDDDTKIFYIDHEETEGVEGGEIVLASEINEGYFNPNVFVLTNGSDPLKVIFVDVTNSTNEKTEFAEK